MVLFVSLTLRVALLRKRNETKPWPFAYKRKSAQHSVN